MNVKLISCCRREFSLTLKFFFSLTLKFVPLDQSNVYKFLARSATNKQPVYGESGFSFEPMAK